VPAASATRLVTVKAVGAVTLKVVDLAVLPALAPLQVSVKVTDPALVGVTTLLPAVASAPLKPPLAVQLLLFVEVQVNVALCPSTMLVGATDNETVGTGVAPPL
jgi:hypothetical protein